MSSYVDGEEEVQYDLNDKKQLNLALMNCIRERNLKRIMQIFGTISDDLILEMPYMIDSSDGGKGFLHKCAQVKSKAILEEIVEKYREV